MALTALIGAIGSIGSAFIGSKSAKNAQRAQEEAAAVAAAQQQAAFNEARGYLEPTMQAGDMARRYQLGALGLPGGVGREEFDRAFQQSPGYQFAMDQGVAARDNSAASRGMLLSGAQQKALTGFGQGLANQEFGTYFDRLSPFVQSGTNAAGGLASMRTGTGNNLAQIALGAGDARASGYINRGNAAIGGVQGVANSLADIYYRRQPQKGGF